MKPGGVEGPHVFVDDLERPELRDEDRHHLTRSLRLRAGESFTASDGAGSWRVCRLGPGPDGEAEPDGETVYVEAPSPSLTIGFALIKGGRPELVVQKLTELGVDAIVPFTADHSVVRWEADRSARHTERLRRVAREAAMQSRQVRIPKIGDLVDFAHMAAQPGAIRADMSGEPPSLENPVSADRSGRRLVRSRAKPNRRHPHQFLGSALRDRRHRRRHPPNRPPRRLDGGRLDKWLWQQKLNEVG